MERINYQREMENILRILPDNQTKLLLHCCCCFNGGNREKRSFLKTGGKQKMADNQNLVSQLSSEKTEFKRATQIGRASCRERV